jgi:hypothetical protein
VLKKERHNLHQSGNRHHHNRGNNQPTDIALKGFMGKEFVWLGHGFSSP